MKGGDGLAKLPGKTTAQPAVDEIAPSSMPKPPAGASKTPPTWDLPAVEIAAIAAGRHGDPFALLGPHEGPGGMVVRAFLPHAETVCV